LVQPVNPHLWKDNVPPALTTQGFHSVCLIVHLCLLWCGVLVMWGGADKVWVFYKVLNNVYIWWWYG